MVCVCVHAVRGSADRATCNGAGVSVQPGQAVAMQRRAPTTQSTSQEAGEWSVRVGEVCVVVPLMTTTLFAAVTIKSATSALRCINVHYCSNCVKRHFSRLCLDVVLPLVEGVDGLPSSPGCGGGCHVVAVVSSFQGAS